MPGPDVVELPAKAKEKRTSQDRWGFVRYREVAERKNEGTVLHLFLAHDDGSVSVIFHTHSHLMALACLPDVPLIAFDRTTHCIYILRTIGRKILIISNLTYRRGYDESGICQKNVLAKSKRSNKCLDPERVIFAR